MGSSSSKAEETMLLDILVPKAFRTCVDDLSTEHLTDSEKTKIKKFVYRYVESYYEAKQTVGEQMLLSDYSDFLY